MNIYNLLIFTTVSQTNVRLVYKIESKARAAYRLLADAKAKQIRGADATTTVELDDDYGRAFSVDIAHVAAVQLSDVAQELNGESDLAQLQAHAQAAFQRRMQADPMNKLGIVPANGGPLPFPPRN